MKAYRFLKKILLNKINSINLRIIAPQIQTNYANLETITAAN